MCFMLMYIMAEITLRIPEEVYNKMKKHEEVSWSEVVKEAILEYIHRLEERKMEVTTEELLEELGEEFAKELSEISFEEAVRSYEVMREKEWKRYYSIQAV